MTQHGQASASTPKLRASSSAQVRYPLLRFFSPARYVDRLRREYRDSDVAHRSDTQYGWVVV